MRRGRWTYFPEHGAWQLDQSGWYLVPRTGLMRVFRGCDYCWHVNDNRRWILYRGDPVSWNREPSSYWHWKRPAEGGSCTHRRNLATAMGAVEKAYGEHVMKTLANLCGVSRSGNLQGVEDEKGT